MWDDRKNITNDLSAANIRREIEKPLSQIAINWLINQAAVALMICGAQTVLHVEQNVASVAWGLTDKLMARIDVMTRIDEILQPYRAAHLFTVSLRINRYRYDTIKQQTRALI